jgi:molecular chaperone GrpE
MTDKNLQKTFKQFGIVKYGAIDDIFDPTLHDALFQVPVTDESKPYGTIGQVLKYGYKLKDRVLRPAEVGIRVKST